MLPLARILSDQVAIKFNVVAHDNNDDDDDEDQESQEQYECEE